MSNISAVSSLDNRFEVFVQTYHGIEHYWQVAPNIDLFQHATPYLPPPIPYVGENDDFGTRRDTIAAIRDGFGRLTVAWIALGQVFVTSANSPGASLSSSGTAIPCASPYQIAIGLNYGEPVIVILDRSGAVCSFDSDSTGGIISWVHLGNRGRLRWPIPFPLRQISVANHIDGRLVLVGLGANPNTAKPRTIMVPNGDFVVAMDIGYPYLTYGRDFGTPKFIPCTDVYSVTATESSSQAARPGAGGLP
jgi:hypothetical protein